jgi:RNA polymerase sigma-70 factor (ECF subfamily)
MSLRPTRDPLANPEPLIRRVYAYVAYRIGDGPEAEDVTSEVFERALRYRDSYDREKGEPIGWLLGIARRCISGAIAARATGEPEPELDYVEDGRDTAEDSIRRLTVAAAVAQLRERDQELISLRYGADLTAAQIARTLELEKNAVEVALHRALGRLRAILEQDDPERSDHPSAHSHEPAVSVRRSTAVFLTNRQTKERGKA